MIHKSSVIDKKANIGKNVKIGPFCYVGPNVELQQDIELISKPRDPHELANCWLYIYNKRVEERITIGLNQRNRIN